MSPAGPFHHTYCVAAQVDQSLAVAERLIGTAILPGYCVPFLSFPVLSCLPLLRQVPFACFPPTCSLVVGWLPEGDRLIMNHKSVRHACMHPSIPRCLRLFATRRPRPRLIPVRLSVSLSVCLTRSDMAVSPSSTSPTYIDAPPHLYSPSFSSAEACRGPGAPGGEEKVTVS
ncbi:hypothetical protein LY76DRAFT_147363 [Colletotrichum caudatum]|nr:hypothetical protein LY76DRAFT_147363 [Colletotrichum caudatum]